MSEIKVDKISPQSGTALAVGDSGDTITIPSGATITNSGTANGFGVDTSLGNLSATGENKVCQAWVNFNGTGTLAVRDSFNVSSVTDRGTGYYTVNFTASMANTNYSGTTNAFIGGATNSGRGAGTSSNNVDWAYLNSYETGGGVLYDIEYICAQYFGD
jgi:hypothetical protein